MDSKVSLAFLESDEGKRAIVVLHVEGIEEYVKDQVSQSIKLFNARPSICLPEGRGKAIVNIVNALNKEHQ